MAKRIERPRGAKEQTISRWGRKVGHILALLVPLVLTCASMVRANDVKSLYHADDTYLEAKDPTLRRQIAEMVCCHCYRERPDGTRFYMGVLEAGFCRSQRGYCEGYAKCFQ